MDKIKQSIGVDIAKNTFVVYFELLLVDQSTKKLGKRTFANTPKGIKDFVIWLESKSLTDVPLQVVMEATGRYHENLAYHLHELSYKVCIVLPNRVKYFAHSLHQFSKTDDVDAQIIAHFGSCQKLDPWEPSSTKMRDLRELTRQCQDVKVMRTQAMNRLSAMSASTKSLSSVIERLEQQITLFNLQIEAIEKEMDALSKEDQHLGEQVERLVSIPGIGRKTAFTILAETSGFKLFKNRNQLIKYAGLDVLERQSGTSIKGKGKISKRGNGHLRGALFMPALSALRIKGVFREVFDRHLAQHQSRPKAHMAVQRKLLIVAFAIHQSGQIYDIEIHRTRAKKEVGEPKDSPTVAHLAN